MTPDELDGAEVYRLDGPGEAEQLAAALEEAAARVRAWPPYVRALELKDEHTTVDYQESEWSASMVVERRPVRRVFDLRWPT